MKVRLPPVVVPLTAFSFFCVGFGVVGAVSAAAPLPPLFGGGDSSQPAKPADTGPRRSVKLALRIEQYLPLDPAVARVADLVSPKVLGTPTLLTLDRDTATIAVTGADFNYAISASPVVEMVAAPDSKLPPPTAQVSWNVRMTGKALPAGTTAVTLTGATRLPVGKDGILAEIVLRDAMTGSSTGYRVWANATLPDTAPPVPQNPHTP